MKCPVCGTNNESGFKFCVKCGSNIDNPQEINYEQVDMGGYHAEEEYSSDTGGFRMGSGTFTISDKAPANQASELFTSEELNDTDEEFDFSSYDDDDSIPDLDFGQQNIQPQNTMPQQQGMNPQFMQQGMNPQFMQQGMNPQFMQQGMNPQFMQQGMNPQFMQQGMNPQFMQQEMNPQQMQQGMNPYMNSMYGGQQAYVNPVMQPQIIGYDPNGMPIYGPMMYAQPQIIGYDQSGMPVYGQSQPMMYPQPQIIGYDQNGMPVYGQSQPVMYPQQQIMSEPVQNPYQQQNIPSVPNIPNMQGMYGGQGMNIPELNPPQPEIQEKKPENKKSRPGSSDDFWDFFDGGKDKAKHEEESPDDFFGKPSRTSGSDMGDVSAADLDLSRLKKHERKKNSYMGDTPLVDAGKLAANESAKFNKMYMKGTASVDASELQSNFKEHQQDLMGMTVDVSLDHINENVHYKSRISMAGAGEANAGDLQAYVREHKQAIMSEADHAVEAMPKKKSYVDELDAIELPEYMQARKTVKKETPEIPSLPDL